MTEELPSLIKLSRPFLTPSQLERLHNETGLNHPAFSQLVIQAHQLVINVSRASNIRFPVRTIATSLILFQKACVYNKFGLKVPLSELTIACLLIACKIEDTPKRCRDLIVAVYQARNSATSPPLSNTQTDEIKVRVLALERQILETVAFDFRIKSPFKYVVKFAKELEKVTKPVAFMAWTISLDLYATEAPLKYPAHATALACIILAAKVQNSNIFPIDSVKLNLERWTVNAALGVLLDYYISSLNSSQLMAKFGVHEVGTFMAFRMDINREMSTKANLISKGSSQHIRDPKISDVGSVRYIIEWERDHVKGELVG